MPVNQRQRRETICWNAFSFLRSVFACFSRFRLFSFTRLKSDEEIRFTFIITIRYHRFKKIVRAIRPFVRSFEQRSSKENSPNELGDVPRKNYAHVPPSNLKTYAIPLFPLPSSPSSSSRRKEERKERRKEKNKSEEKEGKQDGKSRNVNCVSFKSLVQLKCLWTTCSNRKLKRSPPSSRDPLIRGMAVNPDRIPDFWLSGNLENAACTMNI